ncbi:hypothetical protein A5482_009680 [Cyanobacterium sp. IPPAS B-1200]|uniref:hypothetical protein n=1 Tax=Cyanobacterium sp. IPPAS B-1200 TaxID=1562720 RepID=UPI003D4A2435
MSALLSKKSLPFQVVKNAFYHQILLASDETLGELKRVLMRKKFDKYLSNEERYIFFGAVLDYGGKNYYYTIF